MTVGGDGETPTHMRNLTSTLVVGRNDVRNDWESFVRSRRSRL
jgi:hypothetical protein